MEARMCVEKSRGRRQLTPFRSTRLSGSVKALEQGMSAYSGVALARQGQWEFDLGQGMGDLCPVLGEEE